ncbi:WxL domain-containing protein [Enterococcus gallinarum]|uniref:WxL domain-containing protein n=1 Tax=Enterococcus gallinarum TaxID=1353 RepID=UPI001D17B7E6|nr:WxL domain-containing protein [Enterococcus gallinarum]MCC4044551.1 WxL domain-containing protein [Enterococcus gallinarum]
MKGKLQKSWVLSSIVLMGLTTTLPSVNMVLAETIDETQNSEVQDLTLPYDDLFEVPPGDSSGSKEDTIVEDTPVFSLEKEAMIGTVGETTDVVILVDRPTNQVQVTIPQELTVQKDEFPEGLEATQMTETEWWFSADECTKFTIPVSYETSGEFTIRVEEEVDGMITFEEAEDDVINIEEEITDEPNETEDSVIQEVQEEEDVSTEETEDITPATTSNVSTWAQYRTAINTASVTEINVLANISGNTSLNNITRNLTINGNGFTINSQTRGYSIVGPNRQLTVRNAKLSGGTSPASLFRITNSNTTNAVLRFSDIIYTGWNRMVDVSESAASTDNTVIFDGGENIFLDTGWALIYDINDIQVVNNTKVDLPERMFSSSTSRTSVAKLNRFRLLVEEGSELNGTTLMNQTIDIFGTVNLNSGGVDSPIMGLDRATQPLTINMGTSSSVILQQRSSTTPVINLTNVNLEINIENGAEFDLDNSSGGPILSNTRTNNVQLETENLAVWNRGRTSSTPSQNFENIEAQLTGNNAATITSTNHNVFRSTYSKQGLNGYSRISSSGIAGENPLDPLEPDKEIDPDNPPVIQENQGDFRLDFVSQFSFGEQERNMFGEETYYALPQYGLDSDGEVIESEPKPNFVQITDNRADADGWQLSVRQQEQFKTAEGNELSGASLQLKNRQLVADHDGQQPQEATAAETITLEPGAKQPLLSSSNGQGKGTWIYRFGDGTTSDQSVALVVPKETLPEATTYQTKLDWELQAIPSNE